MKEWDSGMTASPSSRDRDEVKRMSNHITRGTLPNPISMSPVALFSPACLCSPESSRPTRFDLPFERNAGIQPSLHYNRAPTSRPVVRSPSPSLLSRSASFLPAIRSRIERSMSSMDYQSSASFRWPIVVSLTGTTLRIFAR